MPRTRDGGFDPQIVRKRQRRLDDIDEIVLSLIARGLTTGDSEITRSSTPDASNRNRRRSPPLGPG